ncbi:hypothetical protein [Thermodesulfobium sp.]
MKKVEERYKIDLKLKNLFVGNLSMWHDYLGKYFREEKINVVEVNSIEELKDNFGSFSLFGGECVYFKTFEITKENAKLILELNASEDKRLFIVCEKINAMTLKSLENKGIKIFKEDFNFVIIAFENFFEKYKFNLDKRLVKEIYNTYEKNYEWTKNELLKVFLGSSSSLFESKKIWDISKLFFEGKNVKDLSLFNIKSDDVFVLIEVLKRDLLFAYFNISYRNFLRLDQDKIWQMKHAINTKLHPKKISQVLLRILKTEGQLKSGLLSTEDSLQLILKTLFSDSGNHLI